MVYSLFAVCFPKAEGSKNQDYGSYGPSQQNAHGVFDTFAKLKQSGNYRCADPQIHFEKESKHGEDHGLP